MNELSKNIRTHILILNDNREIQITNTQYVNLKLQLDDSKFSDPLVIKDADTEEILFDWKFWAIKEFRHKKITKVEEWLDYWICDYRLRHLYVDWKIDNCDCYDKIKIFPKEFRERLAKMWLNSDMPKKDNDKIIWAYKTKYFINWEYI